MTDGDRKRIEEIRKSLDAITKSPDEWELTEMASLARELLTIIDRMRVATSEDVERVARALVSVLNPDCESLGWDLYVDDAKAALRAAGFEIGE